MIRWSCPNGCPGVLGPVKPRLDSTIRFCLECSKRSGRLVARTAPRLERQRTAARSKRVEKAQRERTRERQETKDYYTVNGVDLLEALKAMWSLPVAKEWRERRPVAHPMVPLLVRPLLPELPKLTIKTFVARTKLGHADYFSHEIVLFRHSFPEQDVVATLLHEVAHILVGPRRNEGRHKHMHHTPAFYATLKTLTEEYAGR